MSFWNRLGEIICRIPGGCVLVEHVVEAVRSAFGTAEERRHAAFSISMIALSAKMAKADGVVTSDEIAAFKELFEIPEVREFVYALDEQFPYWLFFLDKSALGLQCLAHCFLPPFLTAEARQRIHREQLAELLSKRWFPAMNQVCEWVGFSEAQIETLTNRSVDYLFNGPAAA